jgi:hypothetical protein
MSTKILKSNTMIWSKKTLVLLVSILLYSCYTVEQNCKDFRTGKFKSEIIINGQKKQTISIRTDSIVIETYEGKTDTASIRWINDCEYVLQKVNPKSMAEKKAINIKILTTSKNSYTFEFGVVGSPEKQKGVATKL